MPGDMLTLDGRLAEWANCKGCGLDMPMSDGSLAQTVEGLLCFACQDLGYHRMTPIQLVVEEGRLRAALMHLSKVAERQGCSSKENAAPCPHGARPARCLVDGCQDHSKLEDAPACSCGHPADHEPGSCRVGCRAPGCTPGGAAT